MTSAIPTTFAILNGYVLHKRKPLTIKIKQKLITYVSLLLKKAIVGIFKKLSK